jgi:carbonic anhydrase
LNGRKSIVQWDIDSIRFHYPAEHQLDGGVRHDLEMQIFHKDNNGKSFSCNGHIAALSVFFNLTDTSATDPKTFFDFQT